MLPVVFYNGAAPWNASGELRELVAPGPAELAAFQASQRYLLIDQHSIDPAELERSRTIIAALFRIELFRSPEVLTDVAATLRAWLHGDEQAALRRSIADWIVRILNRESAEVTLDEVEGMLEDQTMGERFVRKYATYTEEVEDRGLQRGLAQGIEQGREDALRTVLKRQITRRFGAISAPMTARIDAANEAELTRWTDRVLDASNAEAVLAG